MTQGTIQLDSELEQIFQKLDALPLGKAAQLVKALEERWGVSAAAPVAVAAAAPSAAAAPAEPVEEKTSFDVTLEAYGDKKIDVIKAVRAVTPLGLKEAKELVESAPKVVREGVNKEEAEKIRKLLEEAGAKVKVS